MAERYIKAATNGGIVLADVVVGATTETQFSVLPSNAAALTAPVGDEAMLVAGAAGLRGIQVGLASGWAKLTGFTAAPASTSTITTTVDMTAYVPVGAGLRYVIGGVTYYGVVTVCAAALITVAGAPLGGTITALYVGPDKAFMVPVNIPGTYNGSTQNLIVGVAKGGFPWLERQVFLVAFRARHNTVCATTQPKINPKIGTGAVSTNDSNLGITMSGTANTDVINSAVAINTTNYVVANGAEIEIACTATGTGTAKDLTVSLVFVRE